MSMDVEDPPAQTASALVTGILSDLQSLVEQQLLLTRRELEAELRQRAMAAAILAIALAVFFIDAIFVCLTLVHLLHWLSAVPGTDPASLPLWACHAVIAGTLFGVGGLLSVVGRNRLRTTTYQPERAVNTISQEPVPWTTVPK